MSVRIDHEKERLKKALLTFDEKREMRYAGVKNFRTFRRYIGLLNFKKSAKKEFSGVFICTFYALVFNVHY